MAKRNFLIPLAAALAALTPASHAAVPESPTKSPTTDQNATLSPEDVSRLTLPNPGAQRDVFIPSGDDLFQFVIERTDEGVLVGYHRSHYSHRSHSSHQSHSSHYSSRY